MLLSSALQDIDRWSFDVFALNSASSDRALQTVFFELIARYGLNGHFKVFIYDFWSATLIYTAYMESALNTFHFNKFSVNSMEKNAPVIQIQLTFVRNL